MTRIALITTTINVPTVLTQWVKTGMTEDDVIIVAGDQKSPHEEIEILLGSIQSMYGVQCFYLDPTNQTKWDVSEHIGWNCIQRRNIALLEAMERHAEYILTIDDDNAPTSDRQISQLIEIMNGSDDVTGTISTNTGWYNPGRHCLTDDLRNVVHRGFPLSRRHEKPFYSYERQNTKIGVVAMLWTGDPDIDAIERIVNRPNVTRVDGSAILAPGTWAPFNTQATMFLGELAPAMFMWPHVGRYDDIWASYVYRAIADRRGYGAYYGRPAVHQKRNEHDFLQDLHNEYFGMTYNETIIEAIRTTRFREDDSMLGDMCEVILNVEDTEILSDLVRNAFNAWINDVENIGGFNG